MSRSSRRVSCHRAGASHMGRWLLRGMIARLESALIGVPGMGLVPLNGWVAARQCRRVAPGECSERQVICSGWGGSLPSPVKVLIGILAAAGIPAAVALWWWDLVARYPLFAALMAVGWFLILGIWGLLRKAMAKPTQRRLEQVGEALDRALGRVVSGYGGRYRRWVLDSHNFIDVKGLATAGDHTPRLDEVYVDVALVARAPHQVSGDPL
jgi:hypothetical protein